jgi:hypothetical protein
MSRNNIILLLSLAISMHACAPQQQSTPTSVNSTGFPTPLLEIEVGN